MEKCRLFWIDLCLMLDYTFESHDEKIKKQKQQIHHLKAESHVYKEADESKVWIDSLE